MNKNARPKAISVLCIILGILCIISLYNYTIAFDQLSNAYGNGYAFIAIVIQILALLGLYGLWKMKKLGAYLLFVYAGLVLLNYLNFRSEMSNIALGFVDVLLSFIPAIIATIYFKKLD